MNFHGGQRAAGLQNGIDICCWNEQTIPAAACTAIYAVCQKVYTAGIRAINNWKLFAQLFARLFKIIHTLMEVYLWAGETSFNDGHE